MLRYRALILAMALFAVPAAIAATTASTGSNEVQALRQDIERMKSDLLVLDARLRKLEQRGSTSMPPRPAPAPAVAGERTSAPAPTAKPAHSGSTGTDRPAATPVAAPAPVAPTRAPAIRQAVDPAPYLAAHGERVPMFQMSDMVAWRLLGPEQLVVWAYDDEAYLLDLQRDCPGLYSAEKIRVENFSTRVQVDRDAVLADGDRCPIIAIRKLENIRAPRD